MAGDEERDLYCISFTESRLLSSTEQLARAVNSAHEILMRGDRKAIARYLREQCVHERLASIGQVAENVRTEFLKFKPRLGVPGGITFGLAKCRPSWRGVLASPYQQGHIKLLHGAIGRQHDENAAVRAEAEAGGVLASQWDKIAKRLPSGPIPHRDMAAFATGREESVVEAKGQTPAGWTRPRGEGRH